jgi:hypothetical protein
MADISAVTAAVAAVNAALNAIPASTMLANSTAAYTTILDRKSFEVGTLGLAGAKFNNPTSPQILKSFADQFTTMAIDKDKIQTYPIITDLITHDHSGDILRAAITEALNNQVLGSRGISSTNDPNPSLAVAQASQKKVPITTYITTVK